MTRGAENDPPIEGQEFRKRKESAPIGRGEILNTKAQFLPHRWRSSVSVVLENLKQYRKNLKITICICKTMLNNKKKIKIELAFSREK
jgi:hypothetical protein